MSNERYKKLCGLEAVQHENQEQWLDGLRDTVFSLREQIAITLGLTGKSYRTSDARQSRPYIELLNSAEQPMSPLLNDVVGDDGVAVVLLIITLEKGENTYPKSPYSFKVSATYCVEKGSQYSLEGSPWYSDKEEFSELILSELEKTLSFNPLKDFK